MKRLSEGNTKRVKFQTFDPASQENLSLGFTTKSITNQGVQPHKTAEGLKFGD